MPKTRDVKIKEIEELPYFLTISDIVENMGYSRPEVDEWFKTKDFPVINAGIKKVCKYDLIEWINRNKRNPRYNINTLNKNESKLLDVLNKISNDIKNLVEREVI